MRLSRSHNWIAALAVAFLPGTAGCQAAADPADGVVEARVPGRPPITRARALMGTTLTIHLPAEGNGSIAGEAFDEVARLEGLLSNWDRDSELSRLNRSAAGRAVACSVELFGAIVTSMEWARSTAGAFDPTVEPLVWRPGVPDAAPALGGAGPAPGGPGAAAPVGFRHVTLDPHRRTVRFDAAGVGIDLGGIGKGIALDAAARVLRRGGVDAFLLDFGGQVLARGGPEPGRAWTIGIADPADRVAPIGRLALASGSVATSGNAAVAGAGGGDAAGHILDPESGAPAAFRGTVSVVAEDATTADALSTALFVMGPDTGIAWAEERGIAALFLERESTGRLRLRVTRAFPQQTIWMENTMDPARAAGTAARGRLFNAD